MLIFRPTSRELSMQFLLYAKIFIVHLSVAIPVEDSLKFGPFTIDKHMVFVNRLMIFHNERIPIDHPDAFRLVDQRIKRIPEF